MAWPLSSSAFPLTLLFVVQLTVMSVAAQIQAPSCLSTALAVWNWTFNSLSQSPCVTAAYLAAECNNEQFTIEQLPQGQFYGGPSGSDDCRCNSVYYSLISACAGCQKGTWLPYDQWYANCTSVEPMSTFPQSISNDTRVPAWAFVNVTVTQKWDNVTACAAGDNPESTGAVRPPFAPKFSTGSAVRVGVIVGAVSASTVLVFVLIAGGIWYFIRRRRQRRQLSGSERHRRPSALHLTKEENGGYSTTPWTPDADQRLYDPSDPSTYPNTGTLLHSPGSPAAIKSGSSTHGSTPPNSANHHKREYSGLPEP